MQYDAMFIVSVTFGLYMSCAKRFWFVCIGHTFCSLIVFHTTTIKHATTEQTQWKSEKNCTLYNTFDRRHLFFLLRFFYTTSSGTHFTYTKTQDISRCNLWIYIMKWKKKANNNTAATKKQQQHQASSLNWTHTPNVFIRTIYGFDIAKRTPSENWSFIEEQWLVFAERWAFYRFFLFITVFSGITIWSRYRQELVGLNLTEISSP